MYWWRPRQRKERPMLDERFDVVVIGSGMGGSALALALARAKLKVLVLERGDWAKRDDSDWNPRAILIDQRYQSASPFLIKQYSDKEFKRKPPEEVVGGMSLFYGGACLRLREKDFEKWPIGYHDLEPYYSEAEEWLGVHGESGADMFEPPRTKAYPFGPIPFKPPAERICRAAKSLGYSPFRVPTAINFTDSSKPLCVLCDTCDGFPCKIEAKNEAATSFLKPAIASGARLETGIVVRRLIERNGSVEAVECTDKRTGKTFKVSARVVIVAAGAIQSPAILLRSGLDRFDSYPLVGKHLMRHTNAFVAYVFPFITNPENIFHKQICLMDFYEDMRKEMGTAVGNIQDNCMPAAEVIRFFAPRGVKTVAGLLSRFIQGLLVIAEDDPDVNNRVSLSTEKDPYGLEIIKVEHHYGPRDLERRDYLIKKAKRILRKAGGLVSSIYKVDTFSHAVGTVRFGDNPKASALDKNCRFHGIRNLFVVDGSFMPTSGGVNPSLTIAANALRVGQVIASNWQAL